MDDRDTYWQGWTDETPAGGQVVRVRVKRDRYTLITLTVVRALPPGAGPYAHPPFEPGTDEFFRSAPHPGSGYGAYDGRCAACGSRNTLCFAVGGTAIAMGVDETTGELRCEDCGLYTLLDYQKDSS